jgi:D-alanyl-D-alanine dipeptidase
VRPCALIAVAVLLAAAPAVVGAGEPTAGTPPATAPATVATLPAGFVYLADIAPGIAQRMAYAGRDNFTHAPVPGYGAAECVLAEPVARALVRVEARLTGKGLGLVVFDCYRPARAVRHFVDWVKAGGAERDPVHHPHLDRRRLIAEGYIAARSGHSSGGSVDLGYGRRTPAGIDLLDMGGPFDLFDPSSHTAAPGLPAAVRAARTGLVDAMAAEGFVNYAAEWWHFTFSAQPFPGRVFDIPIGPRPAAATGRPAN